MTDNVQPASDRRAFLVGAAAGAAMLAPQPALAAGDMEALRKAVAAGHDASIKRIQDWIANPTIAAEGRNIAGGADYMAQLARDSGFQNVRIVPTDGSPGVFGTIDSGARTWVGVYFMYDVKQFDPAEWSSPPLEGRVVDRPGLGKAIVGRGAVNQKGPEGAFLAALHAFKAAGRKLPVNLVLVAEGEEEIGSPHFPQIVRDPEVMAALRKCRGIFLPSAGQDRDGTSDITLGSKGVIELELVSSGEHWGKGPSKDVHSSLKAMVDSPAWRLVQALGTLVTPDGNTPAIDGWFEKVRPLSDRERALIAENARLTSEAERKKELGVAHWIDDLPWQQALERLASQPTVNIEGLVGGYTGPGGKTILPHRAVAKLDLRLVPNMTAADCLAKLKAHLAKRGYGDVEVNMTGGYDPTETPEGAAIIKAHQAILTRHNISYSLYPRNAGSWPGYVFTGRPLGLAADHFGLGHGSGAHAPNEYFVIEPSDPRVAGLDAMVLGFAEFLYELAAMK
ncbi:MAG: twin-arginine translocation pathway signal protein [Alphaproteobacteria bacterium]|nr:twin-arginine translocation pathway signal protein [Alphaproteobacteria bacterium]